MFSKSVVSLDWGNWGAVISSRPFNILSVELMPQSPQTQCLAQLFTTQCTGRKARLFVLIFRCFFWKQKVMLSHTCEVLGLSFPSLSFFALKKLGKMYWLAGWSVKQIALEMYFFSWPCLAAAAAIGRVGISSVSSRVAQGSNQ